MTTQLIEIRYDEDGIIAKDLLTPEQAQSAFAVEEAYFVLDREGILDESWGNQNMDEWLQDTIGITLDTWREYAQEHQ
jgi:hypothetical protein